MIFYEISYAVLCVFFAGLNNEWIQDGKRIRHGINGAIHLTAAVTGWLIWGWPVAVIVLCNTRVVFDTCLNLFRGLPVDYVSPKPKAIMDKIEKWVFKNNGIAPKICYLLISAGCHVIYYL